MKDKEFYSKLFRLTLPISVQSLMRPLPSEAYCPSPQSVPVRVMLQGPSVPTIPVIETEWNGVPVDAVRIKDLPDAGDSNSYLVRDSDVEGTVKTDAYNDSEFERLWESTPAEEI